MTVAGQTIGQQADVVGPENHAPPQIPLNPKVDVLVQAWPRLFREKNGVRRAVGNSRVQIGEPARKEPSEVGHSVVPVKCWGHTIVYTLKGCPELHKTGGSNAEPAAIKPKKGGGRKAIAGPG